MRAPIGIVTPGSDEGQTVPPAAPQDESEHLDFHDAPQITQALRVIEGEVYAQAYLQRLHDGTAQPGELAELLTFLDGDMHAAACRLIEKALGARHA